MTFMMGIRVRVGVRVRVMIRVGVTFMFGISVAVTGLGIDFGYRMSVVYYTRNKIFETVFSKRHSLLYFEPID